MKKVLILMLSVCLLFGFVACDADSIRKAGHAMNGIGNNVFGITPSTEKAQRAAATVTDSIQKKPDGSIKTKEADKGTKAEAVDSKLSAFGIPEVTEVADVDLKAAAKVVDTVKTISNEANKEALRDALSAPAAETAAEKEAIAAALQLEMVKILVDFDSVANEIEGEAGSALATAMGGLEDLTRNIDPENLTQADVATVAIISSLANSVKDVAAVMDDDTKTEEQKTAELLAAADGALASLNALKVVNEAAGLNIVGDLDFTAISGLLRKDGEPESEEAKYIAIMKTTIGKFLNLVTDENKVFDEGKYNRFIMQMSAVRTSFELAAWTLNPYNSNFTFAEFKAKNANYFDALDRILTNGKLDKTGKFSTNDAILYLVSVIFTEMDKIGEIVAKDCERTLLENFLKANPDPLAPNFEYKDTFNDGAKNVLWYGFLKDALDFEEDQLKLVGILQGVCKYVGNDITIDVPGTAIYGYRKANEEQIEEIIDRTPAERAYAAEAIRQQLEGSEFEAYVKAATDDDVIILACIKNSTSEEKLTETIVDYLIKGLVYAGLPDDILSTIGTTVFKSVNTLGVIVVDANWATTVNNATVKIKTSAGGWLSTKLQTAIVEFLEDAE